MVRESCEVAPRRETRSYLEVSSVVIVRFSSRSWVSVVVAIFGGWEYGYLGEMQKLVSVGLFEVAANLK